MEQRTQLISPQNNKRSLGFTLIEIMVVITIIAGLVTMSMPYISNRNSQARAFLRNIIILSRDLHNKAKLNGVVYRLVLDLGAEGDRNREQRFWVEKSNGRVFLRENEEEAERERLAKIQDDPDDEEKKKDPRGFEIDPQFNKEPKPLPPGLRFDRIEIARLKEPITSGRAYIHYLPQGLVDEAALQIKGETTQAWTISIHPLTGKAELTKKVVSLKEIKGN